MFEFLQMSMDKIVVLATLIVVIYNSWRQHVVRVNDLAHLRQYTIAIGDAAHAILLKMEMPEAANRLYESLGKTLLKD